MKCKLGRANGYEWIMCVDPTDPHKLLAKKLGGVHQPAEPYTKPKYENEARALFGVSMTLDREGKRMDPFSYTGWTVMFFLEHRTLILILTLTHLLCLIVFRWLVPLNMKKRSRPN